VSWNKPPPAEFWCAIDVYLRIAYGHGKISSGAQKRLETLRATDSNELYQSPVFERDDPAAPKRLALRLGNPSYPHMKMMVEAKPTGKGYLYRVDTHDRHCRPAPESREYQLFCQLTENNQKLADAIESAWAREHLPTFKEFLREDLAARGAAQPAHPHHPAQQ
jgi:hypothetical protein